MQHAEEPAPKTEAAGEPATPGATVTPAAQPEAASVPSAQDVQAAIEKVFASKKMQAEGIALAQVGEFSFVMAQQGERTGLLTGEPYQLFLAR